MYLSMVHRWRDSRVELRYYYRNRYQSRFCSTPNFYGVFYFASALWKLSPISGPLKANSQIVLRLLCFVRRQPCASRLKSPIVEWSKHGRAVIILAEIKQSTTLNLILQSGDVHPQPGPHTSNSDTREDRTGKTKSTRS